MCSVDFTRFAGRVARKKFNARNRLEVNGRAEVADSVLFDPSSVLIDDFRYGTDPA